MSREDEWIDQTVVENSNVLNEDNHRYEMPTNTEELYGEQFSPQSVSSDVIIPLFSNSLHMNRNESLPIPESWETYLQEPEIQQLGELEIQQTESQQPEIRQLEESEIQQLEEELEIRQVETQQPDIQQAETQQLEVQQAEIQQLDEELDVQQAEIQQPEAEPNVRQPAEPFVQPRIEIVPIQRNESFLIGSPPTLNQRRPPRPRAGGAALAVLRNRFSLWRRDIIRQDVEYFHQRDNFRGPRINSEIFLNLQRNDRIPPFGVSPELIFHGYLPLGNAPQIRCTRCSFGRNMRIASFALLASNVVYERRDEDERNCYLCLSTIRPSAASVVRICCGMEEICQKCYEDFVIYDRTGAVNRCRANDVRGIIRTSANNIHYRIPPP